MLSRRGADAANDVKGITIFVAVTYAVIWLALLPVWLSGGDIQDGSPGRRLDLTTDRRVAGPAHQPARGRYHFHDPFPVADLAHTIGAALPFFLVGLVLVFVSGVQRAAWDTSIGGWPAWIVLTVLTGALTAIRSWRRPVTGSSVA